MNSFFSHYLTKIEDAVKNALPVNPHAEWQKASFGELSACVNSTHFSPLLEPTVSLVSSGGKRWRPLLTVLCAESFAEKSGLTGSALDSALNTAYSLTPLVELVHTASLIHDDIEDSSDTRRGKPAAYITYGTDTAINSGSWLYFEAAACINSVNDTAKREELYSTYAMELRRLHLGQAMDIMWHKCGGLIPSKEEYTAMVRCKTGTLSSLAARIGCIASGADKDFCNKAAKLAADIGVGFQIIDDVINLSTGNVGKIRGDDIVENKKSLPVILFCKKNPEKEGELASYFEQAAREGIKSPAVEKAIAVLEGSGAVSEAGLHGENLIKQSCTAIENLFCCKSAEKISELFLSMIPKGK